MGLLTKIMVLRCVASKTFYFSGAECRQILRANAAREERMVKIYLVNDKTNLQIHQVDAKTHFAMRFLAALLQLLGTVTLPKALLRTPETIRDFTISEIVLYDEDFLKSLRFGLSSFLVVASVSLSLLATRLTAVQKRPQVSIEPRGVSFVSQ